MADQRVEKLAELLVHYSLDVQPKQKVFIWSGMAAMPFVAAVYRKVIDIGAFPMTIFEFPPEMSIVTNTETMSRSSIFQSPWRFFIKYDRMLRIIAEENTKALSSVEPGKIALASKARGPLIQTLHGAHCTRRDEMVAYRLPDQCLCPGR